MDAPLKALFIDRDPTLSAAVADSLAGLKNIALLQAGSFALAEGHLDQGNLDVLIIDIRVRRTGTGADFIARFAELHPHAGIVLVSADPKYYTHYYPPYSVCLQKPYGVDDLVDAIVSAIDRAPRA